MSITVKDAGGTNREIATVDDLLDHMLPDNWRDHAPRPEVPGIDLAPAARRV